MQEIIIATLTVGVIGLLIGIALVTVSRKFYVEVDEREAEVRKWLPGNNCGACGYAGCDAVAAAIVKKEAAVNVCPVANTEAFAKISEIMGVEAVQAIRKVAFVKCAGDCHHTNEKCHYIGIRDCRSAAMAGLSIWECDYGCLGLGSCAEACPNDGIVVSDGVAVVDRDKCVGCGLCVSACPKNLIEVIRADKKVAVRCSNHDRGPAVRKVCNIGCIGCKLCEKQCEHNAIKVEGNVAHISYDQCAGCGKCEEKCPSQIITKL